MADTRVKICGLTDAAAVAAAADAGAAYFGFVFFPKSPRNLTPADARTLAAGVPAGRATVALTVDADDATLDAILAEVPVDEIAGLDEVPVEAPQPALPSRSPVDRERSRDAVQAPDRAFAHEPAPARPDVYASTNQDRKASMRGAGVVVSGTVPGTKPHSRKGRRTSGSRAKTWMGTERLASSPVISGAG